MTPFYVSLGIAAIAMILFVLVLVGGRNKMVQETTPEPEVQGGWNLLGLPEPEDDDEIRTRSVSSERRPAPPKPSSGIDSRTATSTATTAMIVAASNAGIAGSI